MVPCPVQAWEEGYKTRNGANSDARKKKEQIAVEISSNTTRNHPARNWQWENHPCRASGVSHLCCSFPFSCLLWFQHPHLSSIFPSPHHHIPFLRGWKYLCTHSPKATLMATNQARPAELVQINISVLFPSTEPCPWLSRPGTRVTQPSWALSFPKTTAAAYAKHITGAKRSQSRVFYSWSDLVLTEWGRISTAQIFIIIPQGSRWQSLAQI